MADERTFGWPDYLVFCASMLICTLIGLVQGIRDRWGLKKKPEDGAPGQEKDMKLLPVIWSIVATSFSANFVLGFPVEMYYLGTEFGVVCIGFAIGFPTSMILFLKKFYELGIPSVFDYIGLRFGKELKATIVVLYALAMLLYMGLIIYAPALALAESSALSTSVSILITGVICILYTVLGGLKGVLWIDTLQMMVVLSIGIANCVYGTYLVGGIQTVWETAVEGDRIEWTSWSADPTIRHSFWSCTVGGVAVIWLLTTNQAVTQKFLGLPKKKEMYIATICYMVAIEMFCVIYMLMGVVIYAYYKLVSCEPTLQGKIGRSDQLVPYFVLEIYKNAPGVAGLFTSAVFGASLSTVSAGINALAAMTMRDIVFPAYKKRGNLPSAKKSVIFFKGLSVMWGLIALGVAFLAPLMGRSVLQIGLSVLSLASGPIVGVILLGMYVPFSERIGAFVGVILAIIFEFTLLIGASVFRVDPTSKTISPGVCPIANDTDMMTSSSTLMTTTQLLTTAAATQPEQSSDGSDFFQISYLLYSPFGILITMGMCMVVSIGVRWYKGHVLWPDVDAKLLHLPARAKTVGSGIKDLADTNKQDAALKNGDIMTSSPKEKHDDKSGKSSPSLNNSLAAELRQTSDFPVAASIAFAHEFEPPGYQNKAFDPEASSRM